MSGYLRLRRTLPHVRVLHPSVPADRILRNVSLLVTINSTVGFEALIYGVPVVTLGDSPYRGHGLTHDICGPSELVSALPAALAAGPASDEDVVRLLAWLIHVSHPMGLMGLELTPQNARRYGDALVESFSLDAEHVPA